MKSVIAFLVVACLSFSSYGQNDNRVEVSGILSAKTNDVESVTIFNKSSNKGTITNINGEFVIKVGQKDVIEISALQFQTVSVTIDFDVIQSKQLFIQLIERVNRLDAVTLSTGLSGNLLTDVFNVKSVKPIHINMGNMDASFEYNDDKSEDNLVVQHHLKSLTNKGEFYNGIDFVAIFKMLNIIKKKKSKTKSKLKFDGATPVKVDDESVSQSERRLYEADHGKIIDFQYILPYINLNKILNGVSGRTKMLKTRVLTEENFDLLKKIKEDLLQNFFKSNELSVQLQEDFLYFCLEDSEFNSKVKDKSDLEIVAYLNSRLQIYNNNVNASNN